MITRGILFGIFLFGSTREVLEKKEHYMTATLTSRVLLNFKGSYL